jgi:hypothetical protein
MADASLATLNHRHFCTGSKFLLPAEDSDAMDGPME